MLQLTGGHWTPEEALETAYEKVQAENPVRPVLFKLFMSMQIETHTLE